MESFQVFLALQTEQGGKSNDTLDERMQRGAPVRLQLTRGSRTGQAASGTGSSFVMSAEQQCAS